MKGGDSSSAEDPISRLKAYPEVLYLEPYYPMIGEGKPNP